jgi:4-amino-4-deoxy-L-arabinose transferase-like glycosyltransferase
MLAVFAAAFASVGRRPVLRSDEAWFLWVAVRAHDGASLYRSVYFVTTPLALWIMELGVWVLGPRVWVERALACMCLTVSITLLWHIGNRLAIPRQRLLLVVAATFVLGAPVAHFGSVYSMLAVSLSLAALAALTRALTTCSDARGAIPGLIGSAMLCGAAFASKPNTGLFALIALLAVIVSWSRDSKDLPVGGWAISAALVAAGVVVLATALPFIATRSLGALLGDVFAGKRGSYLRIEAFGFGGSVQLIPLGALLLAGGSWWRAKSARSPLVIALVAFTFVGLAATGPDYRAQHVAEAAPLLVLPLFLQFGESGPRRASRHRVAQGLSIAVTVCLVCLFVRSVVNANQPPAAPGDRVVTERTVQFSGLLTTEATQRRTTADLVSLRRATGGTVFLEFLSASYYYLAGALRNPTRYDYPAQSDVGSGGETAVIRALARGKVKWACLLTADSATPASITLKRVERYIRTRFAFARRLNACDLYRRRTPARA